MPMIPASVLTGGSLRECWPIEELCENLANAFCRRVVLDMLITAMLTSTANTMLYSRDAKPRPIMGHPVVSASLKHDEIVNRGDTSQDVYERIVTRFVNDYGLVLDAVHSAEGLVRPRHMM